MKGLLVLVLTLILFGLSGMEHLIIGNTQAKQPKDVVDYYYLIPDKYFEVPSNEREQLLKTTRAVVDNKNGYIYIPGDGAQSDIYLALFKKVDGSYLIAVYNGDNDDFDRTLDFYVFQDQKIQNITKGVLPIPFDKKCFYELPRYGTTIKVKNSKGKVINTFVWENGEFKLK